MAEATLLDDLDDADEEKPAVTPSDTFKATLSAFSFRASPASRTPSPRKAAAASVSSAALPKRFVSSPNKRDVQSSGPSGSVEGPPTKKVRLAKPKKNLGYAPPETYAHLNHLSDHLQPNLDILFCGINPGTMSASTGHHFAHPTNQLYRALHLSGLTDKLLAPSEDYTMPERFNYGLTNIVARPSTSATELTKAEKVAAVPGFLAKVSHFKPRIVCFVGREIADAFETGISYRRGKKRQQDVDSDSIATQASAPSGLLADPQDGTEYISPLATTVPGFRLMPYKLLHSGDGENTVIRETLFFTVPSTSGRVTHYRLDDRVQVFRLLGKERDALVAGAKDTNNLERINIPVPP